MIGFFENDEGNKIVIVAEFGTGDICVNSGDVTETKHSFVGFTNQEPREIGKVGDVKKGPCKMDDFDVVFDFSKSESIDVIIRALQSAKEMLEGK